MEAYIAEEQLRKARFWKIAKQVSFVAPFVLGVVFYFLTWPELDNIKPSLEFYFSLSACAAASILAGTYFFTYKFFKENFYFFVFVGWVANAIYLIPEVNAPSVCKPAFINYQACVFVLSLTSTGYKLLSLFTRARADSPEPTWKTIPRTTWLIIGLVTLIYVGAAYASIAGLSAPEYRDSFTQDLADQCKVPKES